MISHVRDADLADYNAEEKEAAVRALERVKAAFGHTISFYDSAINNGMEGTVANTRLINAVSAGTNSLSSTLYYNFSLKDSFDDYANAYKDFAEDCDALYKESEKYLEVFAVADYAAQNGVTEMTTANSSRMAIQNVCTSITFSLLCIFSILAAVYCVATEFTRKTVNMLVIRPISRFSIVLSKYCACLILLFGTALVAMILSFLIVGLRNDPADYFQPYIYLSGDNAASVPFLLWFAWRFFVAMIDITFFMTIAFTLSMLIRHTVPAMVITYGVYAFSSVFTLVRMLIIYQLELGFLYKYLPLSYLGMRAEVFGDIPQLNGNYSLDVNSLINGMLGANVDISMYIGLAYALIACGIMFFLSYRSLKKRDIKS